MRAREFLFYYGDVFVLTSDARRGRTLASRRPLCCAMPCQRALSHTRWLGTGSRSLEAIEEVCGHPWRTWKLLHQSLCRGSWGTYTVLLLVVPETFFMGRQLPWKCLSWADVRRQCIGMSKMRCVRISCERCRVVFESRKAKYFGTSASTLQNRRYCVRSRSSHCTSRLGGFHVREILCFVPWHRWFPVHWDIDVECLWLVNSRCVC